MEGPEAWRGFGGAEVVGDVLFLGGDAEGLVVEAGDAAVVLWAAAPGHGVEGEVGERVAQCGEFPIEHGDDAGLRGVEHEGPEAEIAVAEGGGFAFGDVVREPGVEGFDIRHRVGFGELVLLGPAGDLAGEVAAGAAEIGQAHRGGVDGVEVGEGFGHGAVHGAAVGGGDAFGFVGGEDAALQAVHHVERGADDGGVGFVEQAIGDGDVGAAQRGHDAEFAVDGVGAGEEVAGGLLAQDEGARVEAGEEGGVGLAAADAFEAQGAGEAREAGFQVGFQACSVEFGRGALV